MTILAPNEQLTRALALDPNLALLLDLDGTLIPFAATVEAATLDPPLLELLARLDRTGARIVIVSGRPLSAIDPWCSAAPHVWWVAEHGMWRRAPGAAWDGPRAAPELDELMHRLATLAAVPGLRIERKSLSVCVHFRLVPMSLKEQVVAGAELLSDEWIATHPDYERIAGIETLELRRRSANKSAAVAWVRDRLPGAKIIAVGDDETDEDMFGALGDDELAIAVGPRTPTRSRCSLSGPDAVRGLLTWLAEARATRTMGLAVPGLVPRARAAVPVQTRLLVISNRTPPATTGRARSVGGLVSALQPALRMYDGIWLGWSGRESAGERQLIVDDSSRPVLASFDFAPGWREHHYSGFCNRALWPMLHGFPGRARYATRDWQAYTDANAEFARRARGLVTADGTVWVHDYHLLLVARELRRLGFAGAVGLFLHTPFPYRDLFDTLPWADEVLEAMLDWNLIGFHTATWADNFLSCLPAGRIAPAIGVLPIGVDPVTFACEHEVAHGEVVGLRGALGQRKLILGVDRLDYAKGIPERLLAFERLLESRPEWRGKVSFVQISVPSREEVPEYAELRRQVETLVGRINGSFGEADWVPVRYLYRSYDHGVLAQLYRLADVALVTPLRDGLNLVAKEFVVAQDSERPGVLVLSKFAGAAAELTHAILTNPFHPDGLAQDIDRALRMETDERRRRHALLRAALADKTPQRWAAAFLDRLQNGVRSVA